jgi:N-dimethylarginine dimethylaminohydrolase
MIINSNSNKSKNISEKTVSKKEYSEPREEVLLGSTYNPPEFLKKPLTLTIADGGVKTEEGHPRSREELAEGGYFKALPGTYAIDGNLGGSLYPDSYGKIKHMAFQFGNKEFDKDLWPKTREAVMGVYRTLFANMSLDTKFTIVVPNDESEKICKQLVQDCNPQNPERIQIINGHSENGFSIWIRDSMIPVQTEDSQKRLIIQDRTYYPGKDDKIVPEAIGNANSDISSVHNPILRIDGGNVLSNKEYAFIGIDSATQTTDLLKELALNQENKKNIIKFYEAKSGKEVVEKPESDKEVTVEQMWHEVAPMVFESEFKRKVYILGNDDPSTPDVVETQPVFHIDMCTTPIGEDTFIVGDPQMAIDILKSLPPSEAERLNKQVAEKAGLKNSDNLIGRLIDANNDKEYKANFDNLAKELKDKGYNVHRMPYMSGLRTTWSLPYLTYNNCLQENYTDENGKQIKKVYLPLYGMEPLDKMALDTYKNFGYEVVPLDMAAITILEGAIRCSAYPIDREGKWGNDDR